MLCTNFLRRNAASRTFRTTLLCRIIPRPSNRTSAWGTRKSLEDGIFRKTGKDGILGNSREDRLETTAISIFLTLNMTHVQGEKNELAAYSCLNF